MKKIFSEVVLALSVILLATPILASDQIDNEIAEAFAPQGILVKVDPEAKTIEVFKAPVLDKSIVSENATATESKKAILATENSDNRIAEFSIPQSELDKDSSTPSWNHHWYSSGYRWNNWWGQYYSNNYWYRPYSYPGYFTYGYINYNYGWNYPYNGCNYGWYYY